MKSRASGKVPFHLKAVDGTVSEDLSCVCEEECDTTSCVPECRCDLRATSDLEAFRTFESAYLEYWGPSSLKYGLDYDVCTPKELKRFVQDRGLRDPYPDGVTLKSCYIPILNAADRKVTFRFLDLPAEMKNAIYDELLIMLPKRRSYDRRYCHPQILTANKEINNDAKDILNANNTLVCDFSVDEYGTFPWDYQSMVHNKSYRPSWGNRIEASAILDLCELPSDSMFRKIANLDIHIKLAIAPDTTEDGLLQNCLLVFASTLMGNHSLKQVKITLDITSETQGLDDDRIELIKRVLYPLRRLRNIPSVEVKCNTGMPGVPESTEEVEELTRSMEIDMQGDKFVFDTWAYSRSALAECTPQFMFMDEHALWDFLGIWPLFDDMFSVQQMLRRFNYAPEVVLFANEHFEWQAQEAIERLLEKIPPMEFLEGVRENILGSSRR